LPADHAGVCPDPGTSRFPFPVDPATESGVTRKNRHVPCFDRFLNPESTPERWNICK
jgi:hypothetical protein